MADDTKTKIGLIKPKPLTLKIGAKSGLRGHHAKKGKRGFQEVSEPRSKRITLRFTQEEYNAINRVCGDAPTSTYLQRLIMSYVRSLDSDIDKEE